MPQLELVAASLAAVAAIAIASARFPRRSDGDFATMPGWPIIGNLLDLFDPTLSHRIHKHASGEPVWMYAAPYGKVLVINDPTNLRLFLSKSPSLLDFPDVLVPSWTLGKLTGRQHMKLRGVINPILSRPVVLQNIHVLDKLAVTTLENMANATTESKMEGIIPTVFLDSFSFGAICGFLAASDPAQQARLQEMEADLIVYGKGILATFLPHFLGARTIQQGIDAGEKMRTELNKVIEERAQNPELVDAADGIARMLRSKDEAGEPLTRFCIIDNVIGFLMAGYETSSKTMASIFHCLLNEISEEERALLQKEVEGSSDVAQVDSLPILDAFIKEVMGFYNLSRFVPRQLIQDLEISGVIVPAGTTIFPLRDRRFLQSDARTFRVERFLSTPEEAQTKMDYLPFSFGERLCPGAALARIEMKVLVWRMLREYTLLAGKKASVIQTFPQECALPSIRVVRK
ncbi:hypothetical protein HDU77_001173 [Chytriomyces hyalinus]|nr:hypothetical protein HDU77_001173 [Chytriomyces hyalinus]